MNAFSRSLTDYKNLYCKPRLNLNFFAIGSHSLYENSISDLITLFMERNPHVYPYLTSVLLSLLDFPEINCVNLSELSVKKDDGR